MSENAFPIRHKKHFSEKYQDRLNELLLAINVGDRNSNVMSLDDDKKHADFTKKDHVRDYEGLTLVAHPNLRKVIIGQTEASSFTRFTFVMLREKIGETSTDSYEQTMQMMCGCKPNLDRIMFCSDKGHWNMNIMKHML